MPRFYSILPSLINHKEMRLIANEEEYFVRRSMRLHSCYFSKQNLETTVLDQGMLEMLFKGVLPLAMCTNNGSPPIICTRSAWCQMSTYLLAPSPYHVKLISVILSAAKDLTRCPRSFAALRMTGGLCIPASSRYWPGTRTQLLRLG